MITLALVGDVMLGRRVDEALGDMLAEEPWGDALPVLDAGEEREEILARMQRLSAEMGTRLLRREGALVLERP